MSADPKCYALAAEFLLDEKWANLHTIERLAQIIQDNIEQFVDDEREQATDAAKDAYWDAKIDEAREGGLL